MEFVDILLLKIKSLFKRNSYGKRKNYYSRLWILDGQDFKICFEYCEIVIDIWDYLTVK